MIKDKLLRKRAGFEGQRLIVIPKKIVSEFLVKDPVTRQVYITDIGYYPKAMFHYAERLHGISQHIIIYCIEGHGWIEIDKKRIGISPSQFIAIPANIPHKYGADEKNPWSIYWAHFKGENAAFISELIIRNSSNYKPELARILDRSADQLQARLNELAGERVLVIRVEHERFLETAACPGVLFARVMCVANSYVELHRVRIEAESFSKYVQSFVILSFVIQLMRSFVVLFRTQKRCWHCYAPSEESSISLLYSLDIALFKVVTSQAERLR